MKQCNIIFVMLLIFLSLHGVCVDSRNINSTTYNSSTSAADCEEQDGLDFDRYINCMTDSYGQYVLHQAARNGNLNLVKHLHQHGANINAKNTDDETPILLAALNGYRTIVRYLHDHGGGFHGNFTLSDLDDSQPQNWANRIV